MFTLHRPSNVDSAGIMARIGGAPKEITTELPLIFPVHPRTRGNLEKFGIDPGPNITRVGPQAYLLSSSPFKGEVRRGMGSEAAEAPPIPPPPLPLKATVSTHLNGTVSPAKAGVQKG